MKKNSKFITLTFSLILLLGFSFYLTRNYKENINNNSGVYTNTGVTDVSVETNKYNEIKDESIDKTLTIRSGYSIRKNAVDTVISYCNFYEFPDKYDYIIEEGKKTKISRDLVSNITESIILDMKGTDKEKKEYVDDFKNLLSKGVVNGNFSKVVNINNIKVSDFNDDYHLLLDVLGNYMFSIKDDNKFNEYSNHYLNILKNIESKKIDENHIYPLVNAHIYHYGKCKKLIDDNFISY